MNLVMFERPVLRKADIQESAVEFSCANGCFTPYSVEKLCFEKNDDFICDLSVISYAKYESVVEAA